VLAEIVAPVAPELGGLAVAVFAIAACFVCIGIVGALHGFTRAVVGGIAGLLGAIPAIGGVLSSPVNAVAHWMEHEFAAAEAYLDATAAWWLHSLGELWAWLGREVRSQAALLYAIATTMVGPAVKHALERAIELVRDRAVRLEHLTVLELGRLHRLEEQLRHALVGYIGAAIFGALRPIEHELGALDRRIDAGLGALEHGVDVAIPASLNGLRSWARELEDEYQALYHRVQRLEQTTTGEAATAAVAIALAELGLGWTRCSNVGRLGRLGCRLPLGLLEGLLGAGIEALLVADICRLSELIEREAVLFEPLLDEFVNAQAFICLAGGADYASGIVDHDLHGSGRLASGIVDADLAA
jgi:hypothetical protein